MHLFAKIFIGFGLFIFGGSALAAIYLEVGLPWKHFEKKEEMIHYLENKYKDSFELENIRFDFFHGRNYYTYATAASTNISFYVEVTPENEVEDAYAYEYWNNEIPAIFEPLLEAKLGPVFEITGYAYILEEATIDSLQLDDATFVLTVLMGVELNEQNLLAESQNWYSTIKELRNQKFSIDEIHINYNERYISLNREELRKIQSPEDVVNFLKQSN